MGGLGQTFGRSLLAALLVSCLGNGATAETLVRMPGGVRGFSDPLYWLNTGNPDRVPIRERLMLPQIGMTTPAPPWSTRDGWAPWVGLAAEINNSGEQGDQVLMLTPGLRYRFAGQRLSFDAEYAAELAVHGERGDIEDGIEAHGGTVELRYNLGPRSRITLLDIFSVARDTSARPSVLDGATRTELRSNTFIATYRQDLSPAAQLDIGWRWGNSLFEGASKRATDENELSLRYTLATSETTRWQISGRFAEVAFDPGGSSGYGAIDAKITRDLGPRLSVSGGLGLLHLAEDDTTLPSYTFGVIHTDRNARYELNAGRDVTVIPGLADLGFSDGLTAQALWRVDRGLLLDVTLGWQNLRIFDAIDTQVKTVSLSSQLSYAMGKSLWLWGRVDLSREQSGDTAETDTRLVIGLSRDLGR